MKIAILSSCAGFGTYTPSLLLRDELNDINVDTTVFVYETFLSETKKQQFIKYKENFHKNFRYAKIASSIACTFIKQSDDNFNEMNIKFHDFDKYVVMYGLWLPRLVEAQISINKVICLHLDVVNTPSWDAVEEINNKINNIWMLGKDGKLPKFRFKNYTLQVNSKNIVVHGGGWGIDTFKNRLNDIDKRYSLNVIFSSYEECINKYTSFYIPINWMPESYNLEYPPLKNYINKENVSFNEICMNSLAIISKPGGGTYLDSLRFCIPLIYLEPMAEHERLNLVQFEKLGFCCSFDEWKKADYSIDILKSIKQKITNEMRDIELISDAIKNQEI